FTLALGEIEVDFKKEDRLPLKKEIFEVGEQINRKIEKFIREGIRVGELRPDIPVLQTIFLFWAALAGVIQMSANKKSYLRQAAGVSRQQFLTDGFERLYRLIAMEDGK
ncbi:MAG: TetR/AcrR family transcriptional regulator, partial [Oscillospiraceae bacterium]|nr:TetR/AcrR family transcriptional regulator [Oscillospiraceae bacterium]